MDFVVHTQGIDHLPATPLLAVGVFAGDAAARGAAFDAADAALGGQLARIADEEAFEGKPGQTLLVHAAGASAIGRVLLVGLGAAAELKPVGLRDLTAAAVREANQRRLAATAVVLPQGHASAVDARFAVEGAELAGYAYDKYRTQDVKPPTCASVTLVAEAALDAALIARAQAACDGVKLARDLVNGPPVEVTPRRMAEVAAEIAAESGLAITVFDRAEIEARGMNLLAAVGRGSREEPRFIHLTYTPPGATDQTPSIALVGKGLTYDAGGYNLKPTGSLEDMKMDMSGGAAVLGAMKAVAAFAPSYVVHGIVPSSENLISEAAYKPGDIYHALNGKSVEIMNTDAEGRLILADALSYATALGVDRIVDLATLTGACVVALGPHTAAVFANQEGFGDRVEAAAEAAGESMWRLPLAKKLKSQLKSPTADMKNVGERWGGAITAALFLEEFVGDTTWCHLDIAGPAFADKSDGHIHKGGTGFGVLTLLELISGEV
jgi:leucyl aminopeptidase